MYIELKVVFRPYKEIICNICLLSMQNSQTTMNHNLNSTYCGMIESISSYGIEYSHSHCGMIESISSYGIESISYCGMIESISSYGNTPTAWKVSKYRIFPGPYFHAFGLNTERYSVRVRENTDQERLRIWTLFTQYSCNTNDEWPGKIQSKVSSTLILSGLTIYMRLKAIGNYAVSY